MAINPLHKPLSTKLAKSNPWIRHLCENIRYGATELCLEFENPGDRKLAIFDICLATVVDDSNGINPVLYRFQEFVAQQSIIDTTSTKKPFSFEITILSPRQSLILLDILQPAFHSYKYPLPSPPYLPQRRNHTSRRRIMHMKLQLVYPCNPNHEVTDCRELIKSLGVVRRIGFIPSSAYLHIPVHLQIPVIRTSGIDYWRQNP